MIDVFTLDHNEEVSTAAATIMSINHHPNHQYNTRRQRGVAVVGKMCDCCYRGQRLTCHFPVDTTKFWCHYCMQLYREKQATLRRRRTRFFPCERCNTSITFRDAHLSQLTEEGFWCIDCVTLYFNYYDAELES